MYSIKQLAQLSGVSSRTLRYYDQIGLLQPASRTDAGVRMYDVSQVDQLQRILFFKTLNVPLKEIKAVMQLPVTGQIECLLKQQVRIEGELQRLQNISTAITSSIAMLKGAKTMTDTEKFKSFKVQKLAENEVKYGEEIRKQYGEKNVEQANKQYASLSEEQMNTAEKFENELVAGLRQALQASEDIDVRQSIFTVHQAWLKIMAGKTYSKMYHRNLALMYQSDSRFQDYYDQATGIEGAGLLLGEIILENTTV